MNDSENRQLPGLIAEVFICVLLVLLVALFTGCASIRQEITEKALDGSEKTTVNRILATGGARQVADSIRLSNGKTQSIGVKGTEQETMSPVREFVDLLHEINKLKSPTQP